MPKMSGDREGVDLSQSSQAGPSKETKLSPAELKRKVAEVVRYVLFADRKNTPIKRGDISKNVLKNIHFRLFSEILDAAFAQIEEIFGFRVQEIELGKTKMYILLNTIQYDEKEGKELVSALDRKKMGLLLLVLSYIFMSDGLVTQDQLWSFLKYLGMEPGSPHAEFGDVDKLLNQEFTRQMYMERKKVSLREGVSFEYRWGVRAKAEVSLRSVLAFVSEVYGVKMESWKHHYKLVLESEGNANEIDTS